MPASTSSLKPDAAAPPPPAFIPNGPAVAACTAGTFSMLAMAVATIASHYTDQAKANLMALGNYLPVVGPGANGPYAGHEAVMLLTWIGSWLVLHLAWRRREFHGPAWLVMNLLGVAISTVLFWPPFYHLITGKY